MKILDKIKEKRKKEKEVSEFYHELTKKDNYIIELTHELYGIIDAYYVALELNKRFKTYYEYSKIDEILSQIYDKIDIIDKEITTRNIFYYDNLQKAEYYNNNFTYDWLFKLTSIEDMGFARFSKYISSHYIKNR